ncbi:MAG: iron uptake porin [Elainellaceae cyanobacterium]
MSSQFHLSFQSATGCLLGLLLTHGSAIATATVPRLATQNPPLGDSKPGWPRGEATQVPAVAELLDVQPSHWSYQFVASLVETYEILAGEGDGLFEGQRPLTRYEFAAALSQVLMALDTSAVALSTAELETLNRLRTAFSAELAQVEQSVDEIEARSQQLEAQQFSPVAKLRGQVVMAATAGGFGGDEIIAPRGALVAEDDPSAVFLTRVSFFFESSFTGDDNLQVRLVSGSNGPNDNVAGTLEPNFGSTLDYATQGRDNSFSLARAFYSFTPADDLEIVVGPRLSIADYVDNSSLPPSFRGFSTQAFANNFVLLPRAFGGGAVANWNPGGGAFSLRAAYVAGDATNSTGQNSGLTDSGGPDDVQLFPSVAGGDDGGLFGDPHQGFVELEYSPGDPFAIRLQYAGGLIFGSDFDGVGVNAELSLSSRLALYARYGYSRYTDTSLGKLTPEYWMTGLTYADAFKEGDLSGVAIAQPLIDSRVGDGTQSTIEAFYNFPISSNISTGVFSQVILNPGNRESNGAITTGGLRTVFSF